MRAPINIGGLRLDRDFRANDRRRQSFFELAANVFGLSFDDWHRQGYWTERYIPYSLFEGDRAVANVSVNLIDFAREGAVHRYVQIGTVMTAPDYRRRGLAGFLMATVLEDWRELCRGIYLFANDGVLDFYPKFGFVRVQEDQARQWVAAEAGPRVKLNMSDPADVDLLKRHYQMSNPYSALAMVDNWGLLMFHCSTYLRGSVYFLEDQQAVVIAAEEAGELVCYDVYGGGRSSLAAVMARIVGGDGQMIRFGFALKDQAQGGISTPLESDETLFVLTGRDNLLAEPKIMLPLLSHA